ncbi:2'-hydroxyisoflavone reductase [Pandoraea capi]|uniref:2'-hydroxyisoflavone reductase n=1 Tax=Pandoraea capi TaxID=2508286 RepID=A0ABY6W4M8_9BURK|nr:aromatic alcohol reductase [Pandoraea capi]VVE25993.1 2'-hydroxyisoflavone reductase [Pandoraea capi]
MTYRIPHDNHVLVLGAGELGECMLREMAVQRDAGRVASVAVLLRPESETSSDRRTRLHSALRTWRIDVVEADLVTADETTLADIFRPYTQIICCTGFVGGPGTQRKITGAVLKAGVAHYIPWQFGVDYDVVGRGSGQDVWDEQLDVRDMLRAQDKVRWTIVSTGMFTSFVLLPAFGLVDLDAGVVHALGDPDFSLTVTTPQDIGRLTALIATSRPEFDDQVVHVASDTFTYRELASTLTQELGRPFTLSCCDITQLRADLAAHPDNTMRKYRLSFARKDGVAWPVAQTFNAKAGIAVTDLAAWVREWRTGQEA